MTGYTVSEAIENCGHLDTVIAHTPHTFAGVLLDTTIANLDEIDSRLEEVIENWTLDRLSTVDRCTLRLAVGELLFFEDIPPKVTINEYIEIAKEYSDMDAPAFINGILDKIAHRFLGFNASNNVT